MVWQYTEYAGCPYLTDWKEKQFKFAIILDEDAITGEPLTIKSVQDLASFVQLPSNGVLRPHFYMRIGENSSSVLNLEFERNSGLVRRMLTFDPGTVKIKGFSGGYQNARPRKVDGVDFDDFLRIGEYAVRRFPRIADEITVSPYEFISDIPEDEMEEIEGHYEKTTGFPSWEAVQGDLAKDFWCIFQIYAVFEVGKEGWLVRRQNSFTQEQILELYKLVEPLKE